MYAPRILSKGPRRLAELGVAIVDAPWRCDAAYDALVDAAWEKRLAQAEAEGWGLWDGTLYRVANCDTRGEGDPLHLGTVAYRHVATFRPLHEAHAAAGLEPLHHLSTAALVRSADGFYLFGRRTGRGTVDLIGGGVQPDELAVASGADLEANLHKEMREEVGLPRDAVTALAGLGIVLSTVSNVLIIAHAQTSLSRAGLEAAFADREDDEMAAPVFVPEAGLVDYLRAMTDYRRLIPDLL
ncbi:MAG: NUDIX hydrolase [Rhizomicrobium sp.]